MASSGKFDLSSGGSPDRPLFTSGQRGSYTAASMDRSASFRENMENPILSSLPSMSRSTSTVTQADVTNFLQCLRFDPADHKFNRHADFKRLASAALGAPDDSPSGSLKGKQSSSSPEDLKRLKAGLRESSMKARERVKIFSESLSVINKCFPSIPSRKRSRPDSLSGDRSNALLVDRAVLGASVSKLGAQTHGLTSAFDFDQQKVEERGKNAIPNKRTRTSMVDQRVNERPNTPARSSGNVDKEVLRLPNNNALQCEDRALPIVADGWEKSKMKKKRSGIKADNAPSPGPVGTKPIDGYREPKQGIHPRHIPDARSRLKDSYGFRPGPANGVVGAGKADGASQQANIGMRSSIPRPEQETSPLLHDKRDRITSSEKERTNIRAVNKSNVREEFISGSPTSSTKLHATARGPRSGSGAVPRLSPVIQRATASNDWELSHGTNKNPGAVGATNRKRTPSTRSSSPPVAQWADRRPQKMSRTARRTNLVPIVSTNDEVPALDTSDVTGSENGPGFTRRFPANSPQQFKSKGDHLPSSTLSESEESGAAEIKSRDKGKKSDEVEEKAGQNVQKISTLVLPTRKNKLVNGEDLADGVRRQGRTGRGFASTRAVMPMTVKKIGNVGTAKQLRTAKLGFDKSESKSGRPPSRKLSDRKAYTRQKHTAINAVADFLDDGHEELLAAANAVINPSRALSSPFWKQMEPLFGFLSDVDTSFLKQQGSCQPSVATTNPVALDVDSFRMSANELRVVEPPKTGTESRNIELSPEHLVPGTVNPGEIPLCQRLLAALISEEGNDEPTCSGNDDLRYNFYGSGLELEADVESDAFNHRSFQNFELGGRATFSGYKINATLRSCNELNHSLSDNHILSLPDSGIASSYGHSYNGPLSDAATTPGIACTEYEYGNMSINERLLLEIQSIGLYPELVPDLTNSGDEDISGDINRLEEKHNEQVSRKKNLLNKLYKSASEARELQEKEFEQDCLDKLTGMAYQEYMSCRGPNAPGGKSGSSKMAKQAALAFVKRTLERCREFEATGKSCFTEPLFREMLLSGVPHLNETQVDAVTEGEPGKHYGGTQLSPSLNDIYSSDAFLSVNHSSEQNIGKDDIWSSRVKKRELYLDDVVAGTAGTSSAVPSGIGTAILNSAKGKRSERDREGKGNGREASSRNSTPKIGRPASGNVKGERKTKTKLKQKTTQLSASVNGPLGKISDQHKTAFSSVQKSAEMKSGSGKQKDELLDNSEEPLDFSNLQLPEMDVLGVGDDLGEQGQDIGSWLNIDDDVLQGDDFMGLEIPMDDLSDLNMMV